MAKKVATILSHWYHLVEGLQQSPKEFYAAVVRCAEQRRLPDCKLERVDYREGGLLSAKRMYCRIRRKEHIFDICAAPFGTGFFVSWWLGETRTSLWAFIPFLGPLLARAFKPVTYYRLDTALMFQQSVHLAVLAVLDEITKAKGLRALSDLDRKPILSELLQRAMMK